jgi:hypothetical protein
MRVHATVSITARVDPSFNVKKLKKQELIPPELGFLQDVCSLEGKRA